MKTDITFIDSDYPHTQPFLDCDDSEGYDELVAPLCFSYQLRGVYTSEIIDEGFISDCASIPRVFWRLLGGRYSPRVKRACIIHDYIYRGETGLTRAEADELLRQILLADGNSKAKVWAFMAGVRTMGWKYWRGVK